MNGWFGIRIVLVGMETFSLISPITDSTVIALPGVVPTPTDWGPLKYIISFFFELNFLVFAGILILLFKTSTLDPKVWPAPAISQLL